MSGEGISPMKQKIKALNDLASATNITEARHIIELVGYCRKFIPIFSDTIRPLNELTRKTSPSNGKTNVKKGVEYIKEVITTNPILIFVDPNKQYYLLMDSSKHPWCGILI